MRRLPILSSLFLSSLTFLGLACSGSSNGSGFGDNPPADGGSIPDSTTPLATDSSHPIQPTTDSSLGVPIYDAGPPDGSVTVATTIYANTDTTLYSLNPMSPQTVLPVGLFSGLPDAAYQAITDCAVNAAGEVYVITESAVYKAALPAMPGPTAAVPLTMVATITAAAKTYFYALAFAPPGVLGSGEMLVGGDGNGELWSIDPTSGATQDLGNFGTDPANTGNVYALSGDIVFYLGAMNAPTGLATIRSCKKGTSTCYPASAASDFLAGVDMTALATAYTSKTPATSLLKGIYGGSSAGAGPGTGYTKLFGLGAWQGSVYGFSRAATGATPVPPRLISIDTMTGAGMIVPATFSFTDGWSGAGVTTKVTIMLPPPPQVPQ